MQRIAAEHGIDLERVTGTGRDGRVRKQDVLAYVAADGATDRADAMAPEPPLHIESPYRPRARVPPAAGGGAAVADASPDRRRT